MIGFLMIRVVIGDHQEGLGAPIRENGPEGERPTAPMQVTFQGHADGVEG